MCNVGESWETPEQATRDCQTQVPCGWGNPLVTALVAVQPSEDIFAVTHKFHDNSWFAPSHATYTTLAALGTIACNQFRSL